MTGLRSTALICTLAVPVALSGWILLNSAPALLDRPALDLPLALPTAHADQTLTFFDTALGGSDFVWCIDRSCSTGWAGDLATMKVEIIAALEQLTPSSRFSIVTFSNSTSVWSPDLEVATSAAVDSATAFVNGLFSDGATCMLDGLGTALDIAEQSIGEASIILVADGPNFCAGTPTGGTPPAQMASMVTAINPTSIPIHGFHVAAGATWGVETLQAIAGATGGVFVDVFNPGPPTGSVPFLRGDVNTDGLVDISDVVAGLAGLFQGEMIECVDSLDSNDDGAADISDVIYTLQHLFSPTGVAPPAPYPTCGLDLTCDALDCLTPSLACPELDLAVASEQIFGLSYANDAIGGDFNGDGITDLAVCENQNIQLFVGTGGGDFAIGTNYPVASSLGKLATGDFDQDGNLDLLYGGYLSGVASEMVTLLGSGDGTFSVLTAPINWQFRWIETGDINGDGILDCVVANELGALVHTGNGDGTFALTTTLAGTGRVSRALFCDANGDGLLDIATLDEFDDLSLLYLGDGTGGFGPPSTTPFFSNDNPALVAEDLTGDGFADLLVMENSANQLVLFAGTGTGSFVQQQTLSVSMFGTTAHLVTGDFDLDGDPDALTINGDQIALYANDGNGTLSTELIIPHTVSGPPGFLRAIDFDDDGDLDCVTRQSDNSIQITENTLVP